ncbi:MarR family winged helix-turn-helix transcriptional regulator [Sphingobium nicotianae]|uniref:MarR family transcriptional regulator n=1 Tax=Sphingobium nicotianae TaxID=2782607 RepID=A0A9X1DB02_9SPHN|nr:MarR family transcriptional regulator [Sphingobium nicotianae]MBT2186637.1 MarR family transcriptional regulator [Sphingobium nicotianae]
MNDERDALEKAPDHRPTIHGTTRLDREYGFTYRIILVARRYRAMLDEQLRPLGYGTARMEALSTIARATEPTAQIAIAKRIGIEGPTLTRMLDTLEADGLVVRRQDPTDRRTKLIELTPEGEKALEEIMGVAHSFRTTVLKTLSDEELDQVNEVTDKLMRLICAGTE